MIPKMLSCHVFDCSNNSSSDSSMSFYRFPAVGKTNIERVRLWAKFAQPTQDWSDEADLKKLFNCYKYICRTHFTDDSFQEVYADRLSRYSLPSLRTTSSSDAPTVPTAVSASMPLDSLQQEPMEVSEQPALDDPPNNAPVTTSQAAASTPTTDNVPPTKMKKSAPRSLLWEINATRISHLIPRKQLILRRSRKHIKEIRRLKNEYKALKDKTSVENILRMKTFDKVPPALKLIMESTLRVAERNPRGRRWTLEDKVQSFTLFKSSPRNYALLRKMFPLPSPRTLRALFSRVPFGTGVNHAILASVDNLLKCVNPSDRAEALRSKLNRCGALMFDEMAIRKHLAYNRKTDRIDGFQDHKGQGLSAKVADHALVFMLQGLRKHFKQPIAYYLSSSNTSGERQKVFIKEVIGACEKAHLQIMAYVCDMGSNNCSACKKLGSTTSEPSFFSGEDNEIFTIYDPPHLLKCTRNNFMTKDVSFQKEKDGIIHKGTAKWSHILKVVNEDKQLVFRQLEHITDEHLDPNGARKMKVIVAAQTLSSTVASHINLHHRMGVLKDDPSAMDTATFVKTVDEMFDSLNGVGTIPFNGKTLRTRIQEGSEHIDRYIEFEKFVASWCFANHTKENPPPSQIGWIVTFRCFRFLWQKLKKMGFKYMDPRRLNQDALENLFGLIRFCCGANYNPNTGQFVGATKTVTINNFTYIDLRGSNCEQDGGKLLTNLHELLTAETEAPPVDDIGQLLTDIVLLNEGADEELLRLNEEVPQNENDMRAVTYIAGSIIRRIIETITCTECRSNVTTEEVLPCHAWIAQREINQSKTSLKYPTQEVANCIGVALFCAENVLNRAPHVHSLKKVVTAQMENVLNFDWLEGAPCQDQTHLQTIRNMICDSAFSVTVKWWCRRKNRGFIEESKMLRKSKKQKDGAKKPATFTCESRKMKILKHR